MKSNSSELSVSHVFLATCCAVALIVVGPAALWGQSKLPEVSTVPSGSHPAIPAGLKVTCTPGPSNLSPSPTCPVVQFDGMTTWAYSFGDNRVSFGVVTYDAKGKVLLNTTKDGARYVYKITLDPAAKTVTIWGQSDQKVTMPWMALIPPPEVVAVPISSHPTVPTGMKATCMTAADKLTSSTTCPVVKYEGLTTWAYSFDDNRVGYCLITYDGDAIIRSVIKDGARYVYKITSDPAANTVTFWGQSDQKVVVPWSAVGR